MSSTEVRGDKARKAGEPRTVDMRLFVMKRGSVPE
jgi:hypothetical protein